MSEKIKGLFSFSNGAKLASVFFFVALATRSSVITVVACFLWSGYLTSSIKKTDSRFLTYIYALLLLVSVLFAFISVNSLVASL